MPDNHSEMINVEIEALRAEISLREKEAQKLKMKAQELEIKNNALAAELKENDERASSFRIKLESEMQEVKLKYEEKDKGPKEEIQKKDKKIEFLEAELKKLDTLVSVEQTENKKILTEKEDVIKELKSRSDKELKLLNDKCETELMKYRREKEEQEELARVEHSTFEALLNETRLALEKQDEKNKVLMESVNRGIWAVNNDGYTTFANEGMSIILGCKVEEIYEKAFIDFVEKKWQVYANSKKENRLNGVKEKYDLDLVRKDGKSIAVCIETSPLTDDKGDKIGSLFVVSDMTITRQLETKIKESERKYKSLFESANDSIMLIDLETENIIDVNKRAEEMLKRHRSEIIGKNRSILHPVAMEFKQNPDGKDIFTEAEVLAKDGSLINVEISSSFVEIEGKKVILGIFRDVSKTKEKEHQVMLSEIKYRRLFEAAKDGILIMEAVSGKIKEANPSLLEKLNQSAETMTGRQIWSLEIFSDKVGVKEAVSLAKENGFALIETAAVRSRKGEQFFAEMAFTPYDVGMEKVIQCNIRDITDRKKVEAALKENEMHYRTLADSGSALIWTSGLDKKCDSFNAPWLDFTGRTLEQEMGDGWTESVHPEDLRNCLSIYTEAFDNRERFSMDYRLRRFDGEYRWLQDSGCPRYNSAGEFLGYIGYCLDITERKNIEETLQKSENKFKTIYNKAPLGIALIDARTGVIFQFNSRFAGILRRAPEDIIKTDWLSITHPESRKEEEEKAVLLSDGNIESYEMDKKCLSPEGEPIWVRMAIINLKTDENETYSHNLCMIVDITEAKYQESLLNETEKQLALAVSGSGAGLWDWKVQTGETIFNERWAEILGYSLKELSPVSIKTWEKYTHSEDFKKSEELLKKHFAKETDYYECEARMKHKAGHWVWVLDRGRVNEWDEKGKPVRMTGTHIDITLRKQTEEKQKLMLGLFEMLSKPLKSKEIIYELLKLLQEHLEVDAAGIRLQEGQDYPYYTTEGFTREHIEKERSLCQKDAESCVVCGKDGKPELACMCGAVINGEIDKKLPFFDDNGSFWTNSTSKISAEVSKEIKQKYFERGRCIKEGYESLAIIPLRDYEGKIVGTLQLNDKKKNRFTAEIIAFYEDAAKSIGVALASKRMEEERERIALEYSSELDKGLKAAFETEKALVLKTKELENFERSKTEIINEIKQKYEKEMEEQKNEIAGERESFLTMMEELEGRITDKIE